MTQVAFVIKINLRDYRNQGRNNVRRIQPAAHARLHNSHLHAAAPEMFEGDCCRAFEERRFPAGFQRRFSGCLLNTVNCLFELIIGDVGTIDLDALVEPDKVRGCIEARLHAVGAEY